MASSEQRLPARYRHFCSLRVVSPRPSPRGDAR
jgi:hypothetical protein